MSLVSFPFLFLSLFPFPLSILLSLPSISPQRCTCYVSEMRPELTSTLSAEEDTVLPLSTPIVGTDGQPITELIVPAGTMVWVNIFGLNRDKDIWGPDADEWKPERWLQHLPSMLDEARVPGVYSNL